jgi:uncharacterized protein YqeY
VSLAEKIPEDLKAAMKAGDKARLSVLRMLRAALENERIAKREELDDDDAIRVVTREVKRRREAAQQYRDSGVEDRALAEEAEAEILAAYLPAALPEEELAAAIDEIIAETGAKTMKDMGRVMKEVMARYRGRVDGKLVQQKVREKLA